MSELKKYTIQELVRELENRGRYSLIVLLKDNELDNQIFLSKDITKDKVKNIELMFKKLYKMGR